MKKFTLNEFDELMAYVDLEGTEIGDYLTTLACVWDIPESHGKRRSMDIAIDKELRYWLKRFRKETKIIEIVEPQPDRIYKELEWL